jgi:hypothetical protein
VDDLMHQLVYPTRASSSSNAHASSSASGYASSSANGSRGSHTPPISPRHAGLRPDVLALLQELERHKEFDFKTDVRYDADNLIKRIATLILSFFKDSDREKSIGKLLKAVVDSLHVDVSSMLPSFDNYYNIYDPQHEHPNVSSVITHGGSVPLVPTQPPGGAPVAPVNSHPNSRSGSVQAPESQPASEKSFDPSELNWATFDNSSPRSKSPTDKVVADSKSSVVEPDKKDTRRSREEDSGATAGSKNDSAETRRKRLEQLRRLRGDSSDDDIVGTDV